jgi:hypothetical protein
MYLTTVHTKRFSDQSIMSYEDLRKMPGEHTFATPGSSQFRLSSVPTGVSSSLVVILQVILHMQQRTKTAATSA